jgi:hypothetical protein
VGFFIFLAVFTSFLAFLHVFIFWRMSAAFGRGSWQMPTLVFFVVMFSFAIYGRIAPPQYVIQWMAWGSYIWNGVAIITTLSFFLLDILKFFFWLVDRLVSTNILQVYTPKNKGIAGLVLSFCLCIFAYWQAMNVQPVHITVNTEKIAPEKNIRIAAISDLHLGHLIGERKLEKVAAIVRDTSPDILVFLGDIVDTDMSERMDEARIIENMIPHGGGFAVLGNHEAFRGPDQAMLFLEHGGLRGTAKRCRQNPWDYYCWR